jgi:hypothetical protein
MKRMKVSSRSKFTKNAATVGIITEGLFYDALLIAEFNGGE